MGGVGQVDVGLRGAVDVQRPGRPPIPVGYELHHQLSIRGRNSVGRFPYDRVVDVKSLTQAEAETRAELLTVQRYEIAVDLTDLPTGPRVRTVSTITFGCRRPGAETFVDCVATVLRATLNGTELGPASEGRLPLTGLAETNTLVVEAE